MKRNIYKIGKELFITSDEEIKEGDYFIGYSVTTEKKPYISCASEYKERKQDKGKIILTTDQDLIKDGVQAIDDNFLKWFVKNPSCEEVEIKNGVKRLNSDGEEIGFPDMSLYQIIIPKEEAKQDLEKEMFELEQELDIPSHLRWHNSKPKQETVEEVRMVKRTELYNSILSIVKQLPRKEVQGDAMDAQSCTYELEQLFLKWQQEISYSEGDLKEAFSMGRLGKTIKDFNKKFKNK